MRFQSLTQSLEFQYQALAHGVAQHAEQRRVEIEKEKLEKAASAASSWPWVRVVTCKAKILNCSPGPVHVHWFSKWLNAKKSRCHSLDLTGSVFMDDVWASKVQVWSCLARWCSQVPIPRDNANCPELPESVILRPRPNRLGWWCSVSPMHPMAEHNCLC